jgi:hypothetical protein
MLCKHRRLAEMPLLPLDEENSRIPSPKPLQPCEVPVNHFSISSPVQLSEQRLSSRRSSHPPVTAISVRSSSEFLRLDSNRFPLQEDECHLSREDSECQIPRDSWKNFPEMLPPGPEDSFPPLPVAPTTPRLAPQPLQNSPGIPAFTFEGPCFHGLPAPPSPVRKTAKSPLTRHRATVPLIQPSSPVLARRQSRDEEPDRGLTQSYTWARVSTPGEGFPVGETTKEGIWKEMLRSHSLKYPRSSLEHSPSRLSIEPKTTLRKSRSESEAVLRQLPWTAESGRCAVTSEEPPELLLPGASSGAFEMDPRSLVTGASPPDDWEELAFWSPRSVLRGAWTRAPSDLQGKERRVSGIENESRSDMISPGFPSKDGLQEKQAFDSSKGLYLVGNIGAWNLL